MTPAIALPPYAIPMSTVTLSRSPCNKKNSRMLAGSHFKPSVLLQFDSSTNIPDVASCMQVSWSTCWTERKGQCVIGNFIFLSVSHTERRAGRLRAVQPFVSYLGLSEVMETP